jgi:hypothetical protein
LVVLGDDGGDIREFDFFLFGSHFKKKKNSRVEFSINRRNRARSLSPHLLFIYFNPTPR